MLIILVLFISVTSHVVSQYYDELDDSAVISSTIFVPETDNGTFTVAVNQPPILKHHMKKLSAKAGKVFRYIIPEGLFTDPEDGTNLTFTVYEAEKKLGKDSWIQFNSSQRLVYGLPLEEHVSRWHFTVKAEDSGGLTTLGSLDITVQQRHRRHPIEHTFVISFTLNKPYRYTIDWQIRALEGIVNLFNDTEQKQLTVLKATKNGDTCEFVWTNDTLPKNSPCTINDIDRIMKILESDTEAGSPSSGLARVMSPELNVLRMMWRGAGRCTSTVRVRLTKPTSTIALESTTDTVINPKNKSFSSTAFSTTQSDTFPPIVRNSMDHLAATIGHLLIYKVPKDTFFDLEDGGTRNLALSLRYSDRSELPTSHWLQFDARNQEFYGLPGPSDEGRMLYTLIATDSSKKSGHDNLIVEVMRAPTIRPTVEFQMTMEYPFPMLAYKAHNKRKVVEKLAALFGQKETKNIRIHNITDDPTTIVWYNTSLPMDHCSRNEIDELRKMIFVDGGSRSALKENVKLIFDNDFKVISIELFALGLCTYQNKTYTPIDTESSYSQNTTVGDAYDGYTEYSVKSVILSCVSVVIVCVIFVFGIIACELHSL